MIKGATLKAYLLENKEARVWVTWHKAGVEVKTLYHVTEVCERCLFGRVVQGEPSVSKPFWAVVDWSAA